MTVSNLFGDLEPRKPHLLVEEGLAGEIRALREDVETAFERLSSVVNGMGASAVGVEDPAGKFTIKTVEAALAQLATTTGGDVRSVDLASTANGKGASMIGIEDPLSIIVGTTVEAALAELSRRLLGKVADNTAVAGISAAVRTDGALVVTTAGYLWQYSAASTESASEWVLVPSDAPAAGRWVRRLPSLSELGSTSANFGAALLGINDALSIITATTVEGALAELSQRLLGIFANAAAIATVASNIRTDGALAVASDTSYTWEFCAASTKGASDWVIVPSDTPATGRWLRTSLSIGDLSSVAANYGASRIGIHDAAGNYSSTNVEDALAEVWNHSSAGGTATYYVPDIFGAWTNLGAATRPGGMSIIRKGNVYYGFGGNGTPRSVWTAPAATPHIWTEHTNVLRANVQNGGYVSVIGSNVWITGDGNYSTAIQSAPLSSDLTLTASWTLSSNTLPAGGRSGTHLVVTPEFLIIPCGNNGGGGSGVHNAITSAPIATPDVWSEGPVVSYYSVNSAWCMCAFLVGNIVYMLGGGAGGYTGAPANYYVTQIAASTAKVLYGTGGNIEVDPVLTVPMGQNGAVLDIGNQLICPRFLQQSGWPATEDLIIFDLATLSQQRLIVSQMPANVPADPTEFWIGPCETDGAIYFFDGTDVWKSAVIAVTGPVRSPTSVAPIQCCTGNGQPITLTTTNQRGFVSWHCNHAFSLDNLTWIPS